MRTTIFVIVMAVALFSIGFMVGVQSIGKVNAAERKAEYYRGMDFAEKFYEEKVLRKEE